MNVIHSLIKFKENIINLKFVIVGLICGALFIFINLAYCKLVLGSRGLFVASVIVCALPLLLYSVISFVPVCRKLKIETVALIFIICEGLFFCLIFTPFSVPDEQYHYANAYTYSNLLLFIYDPDFVFIRPTDLELYNLHKTLQNMNSDSLRLTIEKFGFFANADASSAVYSNIKAGFDPVQMRLPSALGLLLARVLNFGAVPTFYFGRMFNLLCFALCSFWAIKVSPLGKTIIASVCLLPMTLHVAASYSYDAVIISIAFLLIAFLIKAITSRKILDKRCFITIGILVFLLAPCKLAYAPLCFLVLLIPSMCFSSIKQSKVYKLTIICLAISSILLWQLPTIYGFMTSSGTAEVLARRGVESGHLYTISELILNPLNTFKLLVRTYGTYINFYIVSLIGGSLGWFQSNITAPQYLLCGYAIILFISLIRNSDENISLSDKTKVFISVVCLLSVVLIFIAMALGWTLSTEEVIQGVQGRYFLPILPLFLMALIPKSISINRDYSRLLMFSITVINSIYLTGGSILVAMK